MAIIVRYEILSATSKTILVHRFATQQGATHFLNTRLPAEARGVDIWTDNSDEPKQRPSYHHSHTPRTPWWDENKRPFRDSYEFKND